MTSTRSSSSTDRLKAEVVNLLRARGYERRHQAFRLSSGAWSHDYVDCRRALSMGDALEVASRAVVAHAEAAGVEWEAVGGLTMGADPLAHGIALITGKGWFSVRKEAKAHGTGRAIEGFPVAGGTAVLLVEDVVTTGSSMLKAREALATVGARIVLAVPLLDRGDQAGKSFADLGVRYAPLASYRDLGIDPVGS